MVHPSTRVSCDGLSAHLDNPLRTLRSSYVNRTRLTYCQPCSPLTTPVCIRGRLPSKLLEVEHCEFTLPLVRHRQFGFGALGCFQDIRVTSRFVVWATSWLLWIEPSNHQARETVTSTKTQGSVEGRSVWPIEFVVRCKSLNVPKKCYRSLKASRRFKRTKRPRSSQSSVSICW